MGSKFCSTKHRYAYTWMHRQSAQNMLISTKASCSATNMYYGLQVTLQLSESSSAWPLFGSVSPQTQHDIGHS